MDNELPSASDCVMHVLIDFGTTKIVISCQLVFPGEKLRSESTFILQLQAGQEVIPQRVALHLKTGLIRWGLNADLADWATEDVLHFDMLKSCFGDAAEAAKVNRLLRDRLGKWKGKYRDMNGWWAIHNAVKPAMLRAYPEHTAKYLASVPIRTKLAIPEIFRPQAREVLQRLMVRAQFSPRELVSETELAAAWQLCMLVKKGRRLPVKLEDGDEVLVADGGGFTYNVAICRIKVTTSGTIWEYIGIADSAPLGSERTLTARCLQNIKGIIKYRDGTYVDGPRRISIHETVLDNMVKCAFETFKSSGSNQGLSRLRARLAILQFSSFGIDDQC
ncbi:hypothetical protein LTR97_012210 [Elasticomyces elasticus]|uniref:Uncharacterized protein n=1 Tax=Elasticomyces elasticus TaxID=574655 RepID=A0AAN7ZZF0_9PEZI|nr:hypothetical protein LTR97_012210 [Elasticomyces elasticus]